jgi:hypothetical protein
MQIIEKVVPLNFNLFLFGDDHMGTPFRHNSGWEQMVDMMSGEYAGCKNNYGVEAYQSNYVYLTAKRMYQKNGCGFNRQGWHSDSFMSDDINFLWTDKQSTIFNTSKFNLSQDDKLSLKEMEEQADPQNNITFPLNSILRLNQYVIHKVGEIEEGVRTFVKLTFSKNKFNLIGNSVNYEINYNWMYYPRQLNRNIPYVID